MYESSGTPMRTRTVLPSGIVTSASSGAPRRLIGTIFRLHPSGRERGSRILLSDDVEPRVERPIT